MMSDHGPDAPASPSSTPEPTRPEPTRPEMRNPNAPSPETPGASKGKEAAGQAAVEEVESGMTLGLGTGSTVRHFLEALARELREGRLRGIRGVPTSEDTAARARTLEIPLLKLADAGELDLAVDGADEITDTLQLTKGLGGALLREKMVVQATHRFVVVADGSKRVDRLGTRAPIPVEVVPFGWEAHLPFFRDLGAEPVPRRNEEGELVMTDNRNPIVDLHFSEGIDDPQALDRVLHHRAGVVETGLFLGVAHLALVGTDQGVRRLERQGGEA